jgi:hypothetical protein
MVPPAGGAAGNCGCARPAATSAAAIAPMPNGDARIWVYRDVPPGHYHITVETWGVDFNQSADVGLAAGETAYIKIVSLPSWGEYGNRNTYSRGTFYAWLIPSQLAEADIAHLAFYGGS